MNIIAQFIFSVGFGLLYWEMASGLAGFDESAPLIGLTAWGAYLVAFYVPQILFRFSLSDAAPTVLAQVSRRFAVSVLITLALNVLVASRLLSGAEQPVPIIMEIYSATIMGIIIFHGLGGVMVEQANYLQRTKQYNSNQLLLVVVAMCVLFVVLALYLLAFDLAVPREPRIYVRDMLFGTLAALGFCWSLYRLAHH